MRPVDSAPETRRASRPDGSEGFVGNIFEEGETGGTRAGCDTLAVTARGRRGGGKDQPHSSWDWISRWESLFAGGRSRDLWHSDTGSGQLEATRIGWALSQQLCTTKLQQLRVQRWPHRMPALSNPLGARFAGPPLEVIDGTKL